MAVATQISLWPWPRPPGGCGQIAGGYSQFLAKTTKCITLLAIVIGIYYSLQTDKRELSLIRYIQLRSAVYPFTMYGNTSKSIAHLIIFLPLSVF